MIDRLLDQGYASTDICSALIHLLQASAAGGSAGVPSSAAKSPAKAPGAGVKWIDAKPPAPKDESNEAAWGRIRPAQGTPAAPPAERPAALKKPKFDRPARTGRETGKATLFFNVGRKQLVTPADVVGKIAGVTRLPAEVVGAIDIHQRHTLVDVAESEAELIVKKLTGIKLKGVSLTPVRAADEPAT
jgi:ATP-dependent RNA helicase DeaD